jgi:hypothetical protein
VCRDWQVTLGGQPVTTADLPVPFDWASAEVEVGRLFPPDYKRLNEVYRASPRPSYSTETGSTRTPEELCDGNHLSVRNPLRASPP